jgi:hypothetical protein
MLETIRAALAKQLHKTLQKHIENRTPDFTVGDDYLRRWWIIPRNAFFNIYYHNFKISDDDRAMHDHMYMNISLLLDGKYIEHSEKGTFTRKAGDFKIRFPKTLHRLEIEAGTQCWSLFITGPRVRAWGFQIGPIVRNWFGWKTASGWMHQKEYLAKYGVQTPNSSKIKKDIIIEPATK